MGRIVVNVSIEVLTDLDPDTIENANKAANKLGVKLKQPTRVNFIHRASGNITPHDLPFTLPRLEIPDETTS